MCHSKGCHKANDMSSDDRKVLVVFGFKLIFLRCTACSQGSHRCLIGLYRISAGFCRAL